MTILVGQGQPQMHQRDREEQAKRLGLSLAEFDRLVTSSNKAYHTIRDLGPFYGRDEIKEPTFRICASPVMLPLQAKETLTQLGNDIVAVGRALVRLPQEYKDKLGTDLDFNVPPTWRIDAIIDENQQLKINEIEGQDGASALMIAEQLAYGLQQLTDSTAAKLAKTLQKISKPDSTGHHYIALIRVDTANNPYSPNAERFIHYLDFLSQGLIKVDHLSDTVIRSGEAKIEWQNYTAVISESTLSPRELFALGVTREQLIASGNFNAVVNKGVLALIFEGALATFWKEQIGPDALVRLQRSLIPSTFITTKEELETARSAGKVVKVSWAGSDTGLINRSRGVAIPNGTLTQSSEERWAMLKGLVTQHMKLIAQDFVTPVKIKSFLRKRGTTLEAVEWYNRLCVKFVAMGDPNGQVAPEVEVTAAEVTLGPDVIPAGRRCAFTAAAFA